MKLEKCKDFLGKDITVRDEVVIAVKTPNDPNVMRRGQVLEIVASKEKGTTILLVDQEYNKRKVWKMIEEVVKL